MHGSRSVLFDLGTRHDWENTLIRRMVADMMAKASKLESKLTVKDDTTSAWYRHRSEAIIWRYCLYHLREICEMFLRSYTSHLHIDHVGDLSRLPPSAALIVGNSDKQVSYDTGKNLGNTRPWRHHPALYKKFGTVTKPYIDFLIDINKMT
jgi:glyoxylase-like metal-dependent hydrolase (beta-lactamase superfamily II)